MEKSMYAEFEIQLDTSDYKQYWAERNTLNNAVSNLESREDMFYKIQKLRDINSFNWSNKTIPNSGIERYTLVAFDVGEDEARFIGNLLDVGVKYKPGTISTFKFGNWKRLIRKKHG